jgi:hypothetical protein
MLAARLPFASLGTSFLPRAKANKWVWPTAPQAAVELVKGRTVVWANDGDRGEAKKVAEHIVSKMKGALKK